MTLIVMVLVSCTSCSIEKEPVQTSAQLPGQDSATAVANVPSLAPEQQAVSLYVGVGRVVRVMSNGAYLEIRHGEIPGFMGAMTMLFQVSDKSVSNGIAVNDSIRFNVDGSGTIMQITRLTSRQDPD